MKKNASPMNTEVTVMRVVSNGFGPSKSTFTPGGGGMEGILLNSAGSSWANCSAMLRADEVNEILVYA